jgi:hypothetical protein
MEQIMAVLRPKAGVQVFDDNWTLNANQMLYMLQNHNVIEAAFAEDDLGSLRQLAVSHEFRALFGDMSFDEAYDRYETMLEAGDEA